MVEETNPNSQLSPEELDQLAGALGYGASIPDQKQNVHTFLHNVATADDTTKLGFLNEDEIGAPKNPVRTFKNMALISKSIMDNMDLQDYFIAKSEILTSTSLSREGFLTKLAVVTKREIADVTKSGKKKSNSSWFKKKDDTGASPEQ